MGTLYVFAFVVPALALAGVVLDGLILALAMVDARRAARLPLTIARSIPPVMHQGEPVPTSIAVTNRESRPLDVTIRETLSPLLLERPLRTAIVVPARSRMTDSASLVPLRRGRDALAGATVRVVGPWRLASSLRPLLNDGVIKVFPRLHHEGRTGLFLKMAAERRTGTHLLATRGISSELYALREYLPGDELRRIQWKISARHNRPIVRETTSEQLQHVAVLVDCGRPMASAAGVYTKLDHALAAVIALLRVVQARDDEATVVLFSKEIRRLVRLNRRTRSFLPVFEQIYREQPDLDEPDYASVAAWCSRRLPRRSLAILCTSIVELGGATRLGEALRALASRHLTLLVNLIDPSLAKISESIPDELLGAYAKTSAMATLAANRALEARLRAHGIDVLTTPADRLAMGMVERYLEVKRHARL